jgi:hypothetical protein
MVTIIIITICYLIAIAFIFYFNDKKCRELTSDINYIRMELNSALKISGKLTIEEFNQKTVINELKQDIEVLIGVKANKEGENCADIQKRYTDYINKQSVRNYDYMKYL